SPKHLSRPVLLVLALGHVQQLQEHRSLVRPRRAYEESYGLATSPGAFLASKDSPELWFGEVTDRVFLADHNRDIIGLRHRGGNTTETSETEGNKNDRKFKVQA